MDLELLSEAVLKTMYLAASVVLIVETFSSIRKLRKARKSSMVVDWLDFGVEAWTVLFLLGTMILNRLSIGG